MTFGLLPLGTNRVLLGFHQWALARGRYKCPLFRSAAALVSVGNRGMRTLAPPNTPGRASMIPCGGRHWYVPQKNYLD